jgi:acetylornithine deacetylase/succinyl-diaminopimelate desuccinylase-like protein
MNEKREAAIQYVQENRERFLEELKQFLSIPSISTDSSRRGDIQEAAQWLVNKMKSLEMENVQIMETSGNPVVYGEYLGGGASAPTVLIYGHYDVQPPDPLDLWESPPFEPVIRGDNLFARGATDMKGQIVTTINALEAIIKTGHMPINLKFILEGEEEIGSPNLAQFLKENQASLGCDFAANPDSGMIAADKPTITYALRGLAYFEIRLEGPRHDLHSGQYGGVVHNPAQVLCDLVAGMHDEEGRVTLPGFYDKVRSLSDDERAELSRLPMDENYYLEQSGAPALWGEQGYTPVERVGARPTLEVNGLLSGYTSEGIKTVLPAWAMAKISCRLVSDQDPDEVHQQILQYFQEKTPETVKFHLTKLAWASPSISDRHSPGVEAMAKAMQRIWGRPPLFRREGGTVPVVGNLQKILGVETANCGFSLPEDNMHAPNEKIHLPTWDRGIQTFIHFFYNAGE